MSLLDWNKVQRGSLSGENNMNPSSHARPSIMTRTVHRRRSVEAAGLPPSTAGHNLARHSLQVEDLMSRPSEQFYGQDPSRGEYNIVWDNSFLGIVFRCNSKNQAVIRRIEAHAAPPVLQFAQVGDVLLAFNGEPTASYDKTMERLRSPVFPATLTFGPPRAGAPGGPYLPTTSASRPPSVHSSVDKPHAAPSLVSTDMNESIMSYDDPDNLHHTTFDVVWHAGVKLGVSIVSVGNIPVVKNRTAESEDPALAQIQPNDQLVSIQGNATIDLGYKASIVLLRDALKPVHLVFRRKATLLVDMPATPAREADYSIVWESGPLGLTLKKDKAHEAMVVARINGDGLAARCNLISLGDRLVSVSNVAVTDLGLRGAMEFLKAVPKPAMLVFRRCDADETSSVSSSMLALQMDNSKEPVAPPVATTTLLPRSHTTSSTYSDLDDKDEDDDLVAPLVVPKSSPIAAAPRSGNNQVLPRSNTSSSTYSDLDDSGLYDASCQAPLSMAAGPPVIEILWATGPLGITLKQVGETVVVSRITGKGEAQGLADLQPGDVLVGVNDMDTATLNLEVATTMLKSLQKPVRLNFMLRKTEEDL
ncbi:Aste57867_16499 [Aphanomyces stellatus]|uniref:Aste57867_16499 protein n=1 Tax=Aphanomyces stellatus TaxID=120398 RepID=A0A485L7H3_9STRA|nr:hypothetical protein As57867_016442 [Aphanomyces stellatus]VFT93273.1 Aste57867_16499 [Aphanomyces stellatus]